ncbi:DUF3306 domain-containing protein [Bordetella petrii]|uniref:DUF3306 domain-containing protein n=1 Tax=Bordetella petrii (strain ATCC BAA-461 / DSM 12804 / CCUG 43448 / CIP 107267 / Se-1111R) TaxID=340100 RepID=A9IFD3_BORPD|nr:DUF3306 domain-containing protein [Bordetella petrii]CAP45017.1 conserved hypothetical protein [Bordetella petrii]
MTAPGHDGFLRRWSRRKEQARGGQAPDDAPPSGAPQPLALADGPADAQTVPPPAQAPAEPPPLTLDDVRALTPESDFAPFVARQVAPDVKNAALKKLFSDPHYNVMDGLDTYIDDYSSMEALPAPMLRRLASARALAMFESAEDALPADPAPVDRVLANQPPADHDAAPSQAHDSSPAAPLEPLAAPADGAAATPAADAVATGPGPGRAAEPDPAAAAPRHAGARARG